MASTARMEVIPTFGGDKKKPSTHATRRVAVLNKIFMKHITDLMSTGEVAPQLAGRGIEITHVKVAPNFRLVNVFWVAENEKDANESTERILKKAAGHLEHELSQLKIIGMVPPINFVKNKFYNSLKEVEYRLATVDFGEDFVPSAYIQHQVKTPVLQMSLSSDIKAKLSQVDRENNEAGEVEEELYEIQIPEMRQDVLGFDHAAIMTKVNSIYLILIFYK